MIASSPSDTKASITPTSRYSQAENVQKRDNPGSDSKRAEATLITTKKAQSAAKKEANEIATYIQSLATIQQSQQPGITCQNWFF